MNDCVCEPCSGKKLAARPAFGTGGLTPLKPTLRGELMSLPSYDMNQCARFCTIGPPRVKPY